MKSIFKKYWPLCTLGIVVLAVLCAVLFFVLRSTPEKAVEGYIRASLEYDADALLSYASEFQITALGGFEGIDTETLRKNLEARYELAAEYRESGKITFDSEVVELPEEGTERYQELLDYYGFKGTPEDVDAFAVVEGICYVDGKARDDYRVVAVKCGLTWYYGFIE